MPTISISFMKKSLCSIVAAFIGLIVCTNSSLAGEHRYAKTARLSHTLTSGQHTPQWTQPLIDQYHPIGCGPTAWAIVYAYWFEFKGKNNLFTQTPDYTETGHGTSPVLAVENDVAYLTETSYGQAGSGTWGRTWANKLCQGIDYAKKKGYGHSRCMKIYGSEFDKYQHIKRYLEADKPVILNINHEGQGILDHYVIIEQSRVKQEKVGDRWIDRDIEYLANFGWGDNATKWISVRQRGANEGTVYTSAGAYLIDVSDVPLTEAADANEAACKDWCASPEGQADGCRMCSHLAECGPGYKSIRDWTAAGKNWHACAQRGTDRAQASESLRQSCEQWCNEHRTDMGCLKCDTRLDCGPGYRNLKSWTGYGNNWHACRAIGTSNREQQSEDHHQQCQKWCDSNKPDCVYCSKQVGCGVGFETLQRWTGYGTNWHACGKNEYGINSENNKRECSSFCQQNFPTCQKCSSSVGCGAGFTAMKTFGGKGENWYACRAASSQANQDACETWCNQHKPRCAKCSTHAGCGVGFKQIETFRGRGDNWFACERR